MSSGFRVLDSADADAMKRLLDQLMAAKDSAEEAPSKDRSIEARTLVDAAKGWLDRVDFKVGDLVVPKSNAEFPGPGHWREGVLAIVVEVLKKPERVRGEEGDLAMRFDMIVLAHAGDCGQWAELYAEMLEAEMRALRRVFAAEWMWQRRLRRLSPDRDGIGDWGGEDRP